MKPPNVKCLSCNKECYMPKNRLKTFKYCSRKCKDAHNTIKIKANCFFCKNEFEHISCRANKAKYCSRKCYYKSQTSKDRGTKEFICERCGNKFMDSPSKKRKFCSKDCILNIKWVKNPCFTTVRKYMIRRNLIRECEICGYNKIKNILGVHHKDGNRKNNSLKNLQIVCPMCHSLIHHKHICH